MKKLLAIILAVVLCSFTLLVGCGGKNEDKKTTPSEDNIENTDDTNSEDNAEGTDDTNSEDNAEGTDDTNSEDNVEGTDDPENETPLSYSELNEYVSNLQAPEALDKEILVTLCDVPFSAASVKYATQYVNTFFETEEEKATEMENFYRLNAGIVLLSEELGAGLTPHQFKSYVEVEQQYLIMYYGEDYESYFIDAPYTPHFYFLNIAHNYLYSGIYSKLLETDEAFRDNIMTIATEDALSNEDYIRVKHVLVTFPEGAGENGEVTDEQKAETFETATTVYKRASAMTSPEDFDALIAEYNEDPGMTSYPGGYYFTYGEMIDSFETAAFGLEDFGISEPVETTHGYHIIQRLPVDYEGLENTSFTQSNVYNAVASEILMDMVLEKTEGVEIVYAENYSERVDEFKAEYDEILARQEAEAKAQAETDTAE